MKTETKCRVAACAAGFALPRYADLPQMGLYLDQTVQYVNSYFRTFCGVELTSSMVSNYVKKGILSHPVRKKYARDQIAKQQHMDKIDDIKGVQNEIAWGHQIRSYVFMPYTMVKDHRTNYETGNVDAVMDGDLDGFIFAYLKAASRGELQDT